MSEQTQDVNIEVASSTASTNEGVVSPQDVNANSSVAKAATEKDAQPSLEDVLKQGFKDSVAKAAEPSTAEDKAEGSDVQQLNKTPKQEAEPVKKEGETDEAEEEEAEVQEEQDKDKGPVPYDRFQSVVQERNEVKEKFERVKPMVEAQEQLVKYCQDHGVTNEDFVKAMEVVALLKTDPEAAWNVLKPIVEGLGVFSGESLPADLAKDVEDGAITKERAQELAKLRAQTKYRGETSAAMAKQQQERQQQEFVKSIHNAWAEWDSGKRKANPDFKPNTNGLWELVNDRMTAMTTATGPNGQPMNPIKSPQDALALAEAAYKFVMGTAQKMVPKNGARRVLTSNNSSQSRSKSPLEMPTFEEAMKAKARELGIE